jgi:hypothetical protein
VTFLIDPPPDPARDDRKFAFRQRGQGIRRGAIIVTLAGMLKANSVAGSSRLADNQWGVNGICGNLSDDDT